MCDGSQYPAPVCGAVTGANQSTVVPRPCRQRLLRAALLPPGAVPDVLVPGAAGVGRHVVGPAARRSLRLRDAEARRPLVAAAVVPGLPREALAEVSVNRLVTVCQVTVPGCESEGLRDRTGVGSSRRRTGTSGTRARRPGCSAGPRGRGRDQARALVGRHGDHGQVHAAHPLDQRSPVRRRRRPAALRRARRRSSRGSAGATASLRVTSTAFPATSTPAYSSAEPVPTNTPDSRTRPSRRGRPRLVHGRDLRAARSGGDQVQERLGRAPADGEVVLAPRHRAGRRREHRVDVRRRLVGRAERPVRPACAGVVEELEPPVVLGSLSFGVRSVIGLAVRASSTMLASGPVDDQVRVPDQPDALRAVAPDSRDLQERHGDVHARFQPLGRGPRRWRGRRAGRARSRCRTGRARSTRAPAHPDGRRR